MENETHKRSASPQGLLARLRERFSGAPSTGVDNARTVESVLRPEFTRKAGADERDAESVLRPAWQIKPGADDKEKAPRQEPQQPPTVKPERLEIEGYVARQPRLKTKNGIPYVRLHIGATSLKSDGHPKDPELDKWHSVVVFGREAHERSKLQPGERVAVAGDRIFSEKSLGAQKEVVSHIVNPHLSSIEKLKEPTTLKAKGEVFREPALLATDDGRAYTRVLIYADMMKQEGESKTLCTRWHTAVFWDSQAKEVAETIKKGAKVEVEGKLVTVAWKQDGQMFEGQEIRNPSLKLLETGKAHQPARAKEAELLR